MGMWHPDAIDGPIVHQIDACPNCEPDRRPRMFVCDYHEGWLAAAEDLLDTIERLRADLEEARDLYDLWRVKCNEFAAENARLRPGEPVLTTDLATTPHNWSAVLPDAEHIHLHRLPDGGWTAVAMERATHRWVMNRRQLGLPPLWADVPADPEDGARD